MASSSVDPNRRTGDLYFQECYCEDYLRGTGFVVKISRTTNKYKPFFDWHLTYLCFL